MLTFVEYTAKVNALAQVLERQDFFPVVTRLDSDSLMLTCMSEGGNDVQELRELLVGLHNFNGFNLTKVTFTLANTGDGRFVYVFCVNRESL